MYKIGKGVVGILQDLLLAKGRIDRLKFSLLSLILILMPKIIIGFHFLTDLIKLLILLVIAIIQIYLIIMRLHDINRSGLFLLIVFIPIINGALLLFLALKKGTDGHNSYGPNPLDRQHIRPSPLDHLSYLLKNIFKNNR
jgi:uncharacterized membrane protein YhaH (DUF805 family)